MLKGELNNFSIISVFEMLNQQQRTGILEIKSSQHQEVLVYFNKGDIIDLSYEKEDYSLDTFLLKRNIVSTKLLKKMKSRAKKEMKLTTTILVEMNYITPDLESGVSSIAPNWVILAKGSSNLSLAKSAKLSSK